MGLLNIEQELKCPFSAAKKFVDGILGAISLHSTFTTKIKQLEKEAKPSDSSLLSNLVFATSEDNKGRAKLMNRQELIQNAFMITFSGYDTTHSALSLATFLLGSHSKCWARVVEEQRDAVMRHGEASSSNTSMVLVPFFRMPRGT